jgi:SPP1 family phage portal protein
MNILNWFTERFRQVSASSDGRTLEERLSEGDIQGALALMTDNSAKVSEALAAYDIKKHSIVSRQDRAIFGRKDPMTGARTFLRYEKRWKIPIPYAAYINELALVYLYGRPLKWSQASEGTDAAFRAFTEWMDRIRFDAKIRQAKRIAGAETQSAILFHVYRNGEGRADLLLKTLGKSLGDDIYFRKDQFDRLTAFARGYTLSHGGKNVSHLDIYTKEKIYLCRRAGFGWETEEQANPAGKIPVILFEQETEFAGVEAMIERREWMTSHLADVNDRFSSPTLVAIGDQVVSLPDRMEDSKAIHIRPSESGRAADVKYLTWDSASESKRLEGEDLDRHILNKTFTPDISREQLKDLSSMSGKALKQLMFLAGIKAERRRESHDEYASRIGSLMKAIIGNVLQAGLKRECEKLRLTHTFQEPFGEDVKDVIDNLIRTYNAGGLSLESFVEMNPIIPDAEAEKNRLSEEQEKRHEEEARRARMEVFGSAD